MRSPRRLALRSQGHALTRLPACNPRPPLWQAFEEQRSLLDSLARKLGLAGPGSEQAAPFSGPQWSWQLPEGGLISENSQLQPPRPLLLDAAAPAAVAAEGQPAAGGKGVHAAAADPRREPAAAAELQAARDWYRIAEVPLPEFAAPAAGPADSGLSWSQTPKAQGQAEVSSVAPGTGAMGAGEGGWGRFGMDIPLFAGS